jgi:glycosyltransferase involved in cell wall biosynthesis
VNRKKRVLFVGSFIETSKDGSVGGQMFACRSLIESDLSSEIDWILLDTTGKSVPPPAVYYRMFSAFKRVLIFIYFILTKHPDSVLIFAANCPSIFEKGCMAIIGSFFSINVIIAPRGGPLDMEITNNTWVKKFVQLVFNRCNYIICQGVYWKSFFSELVDKKSRDKFILIPNWIDSVNYDVSKYEVKNDAIIRVLFMGWIQEDKGVHDIFSALENVRISDKQVEFVFLGDGPSRQFFIDLTKSRKLPFSFSFPGWVHGKEKLAYLANTDIFILPSHSEGLPNSLMEAMLSGVACIATNVGSVSDLIIDGITGVLIEKKNIEQLSFAIQELILDEKLRKVYSIEGQKRILLNHSIQRATELFKKILT